MFKIKEGTLAGAVANNATFVVPYPAGTNPGTYFGGVGHSIMVGNSLLQSPATASFAFGDAGVTVTNKSGVTLASGSHYRAELVEPGLKFIDTVKRTIEAILLWVNLGAPDTLDADGVVTAVDPAANAELTLNGALVTGGVATFDVPRNVTITSAADDSAKSFTVTGTDEYGVAMVETITGANAGVAAGKKAFKTVTSVVCVGNPGSITVGTGDVLGLPFFLPDADFILKEMEDGTVKTNGTFVAGDLTTPSDTTGDVRGTYDPNSACNGALSFRLVVAATEKAFKGLTQYS